MFRPSFVRFRPPALPPSLPPSFRTSSAVVVAYTAFSSPELVILLLLLRLLLGLLLLLLLLLPPWETRSASWMCLAGSTRGEGDRELGLVLVLACCFSTPVLEEEEGVEGVMPI